MDVANATFKETKLVLRKTSGPHTFVKNGQCPMLFA